MFVLYTFRTPWPIWHSLSWQLQYPLVQLCIQDAEFTSECWIFEPPHYKTNKMTVRPAKTQISLGIHPVWSESLLSAWRNLGSLATHWAHNEDSDQTGWMPRLIWVFAGCTLTLLVLSWDGSFSVSSLRFNSFPIVRFSKTLLHFMRIW